MLYLSMAFLVVSLVAVVFGFGGLASTEASTAQVLFFVFLAAFVVSLVAGGIRRSRLQ